MRREVSVIESLAVGVALAIPLAVSPAMAQTARFDPPLEEERMPAMMRMMDDMHRDMERMTRMMERHQQRMESSCPGFAPREPKSGR